MRYYYDDEIMYDNDNYELPQYDYEMTGIVNNLSEVEYLEKEITKVEKQIRELWVNVIVPYMGDENKQILNNMTYNKFFDYILSNNVNIRNLYYRYNRLINQG